MNNINNLSKPYCFNKQEQLFPHCKSNLTTHTVEEKFKELGKLNECTPILSTISPFNDNQDVEALHLKVIAQLGAEHLSIKREFSGSNYQEVISALLMVLDGNDRLARLLKEGDKFGCQLQTHANDSELLKQSQMAGNKFIAKIKDMTSHKEFLFPVNLKCEGTNEVHALLLHVIKQPNNKFTLKIFNTGHGLSNYHSVRIFNGRQYIQSYLEVSDIIAENLTKFYARIHLLASGYKKPNMPGIETLYTVLLPLTQGRLNSDQTPHMKDSGVTRGQRGNSCSASSIRAFFRYALPKNDYQNFKVNLRLNFLLGLYHLIRHGDQAWETCLAAKEIGEKIKKHYLKQRAVIPMELVQCLHELDQLHDTSFRNINSEEQMAEWQEINDSFILKFNPVEELFRHQNAIISKDKTALCNLYAQLCDVEIDLNDMDKIIAISVYLIRLIDLHFSTNPDIALAAGLCTLIYKNLNGTEGHEHRYLPWIKEYCLRIISCYANQKEEKDLPWSEDADEIFHQVFFPRGLSQPDNDQQIDYFDSSLVSKKQKLARIKKLEAKFTKRLSAAMNIRT